MAKNNKNSKSIIPLSNESLKKALLGATIIASGFGLIGNTSTAYAAKAQSPTKIEESVNEYADQSTSKDYKQTKVESSAPVDKTKENLEETPEEKSTGEAKEDLAKPVVKLTNANDTTKEKVEEEKANADNKENPSSEPTSKDEPLADKEEPATVEKEKTRLTLDEYINNKDIETLFDADKIKADAAKNLDGEKLEAGQEKKPEPQKAPEEASEPNYAEDEAKIKDFSEDERYRSSQMEPGEVDENGDLVSGGPSNTSTAPDMESKDGFSYNTLEPSKTSGDKTKWGIEMEFDKEKGQRTYTDFGFTNTGNLGGVLDTGKISANDVGDKLADGFKDPNYKANAEIDITASRSQRNLNLYATEEDLRHINSIENNNTTIAWEGKYTKDPTDQSLRASQGTSAAFTFTVNPWPNENDKLQLIKLNGSHDNKEFVQGQTITTNVQVENLDASARERLVGQVYHPITGKVVPGAKAYINDQGKVVVEMPKGTINADGSLNEDSIFYNDPNYVGIQNLEVKFFARPRTAGEFKAISDEANFGGGHYTSTGAGTKKINHNGKEVEVDLQGIDRYDHYNLIGGFKLNLDDTRYYDQDFIDKNKDDTSKHTHSNVKPGEEFNVDLYVPEAKTDKDAFPNQKTPEEMEAAKDKNQTIASIDYSFLDKINEGKEDKDKWVLDYDKNTLPTTLKITPPSSAKAGDFVAVPLTYTYTNGSTDVHWFHFVVQESDNNRPEYLVQVEYPSDEQNSTPKLPDDPDEKKLPPKSYSIPEGTEFKDDEGNEWDVSINPDTGVVTAKPKDPSKFFGGEKLQVPVVTHYQDPNNPEEDITENTIAEFVIKEKSDIAPDYDAKTGKAGDKLSSSPKLDEEDKFNKKPDRYTLDSNTYEDENGNIWNVSIDEETGVVTATVPNAEEGKTIKLDGTIINVPVTAHYKGADGSETTKKANVQFLGSGTEGTHEYTEKIPFETTIEYDPNFYEKYPNAENNYKVVTEGELGSKTTKLTIKDSKVVKEEEVAKTNPKNAKIVVGDKNYTGVVTHTEKVEVPYTVEYRYNPELKEGEMKTVREGKNGSYNLNYSQKIKNGQADGNAETSKTDEVAPVNKIIEIGSKPASDTITITKGVEYELDYSRKDGEPVVVEEGNDGVITIKTTRNPDTGEITITQEVTTEVKNKKIKIPAGTEGKHEYTEKIPFKYEIEYDENLKSGEYVIDVPGSEGSKTTTWNIVNSKVVGEPTVEVKDPVNAKIRVGKKDYTGEVKHTEKIETPFEVEYQYSDELEAGETKVIQKGEKGSYDLEYSQKIKNGEADGDPTTAKTNVIEAKKEIIVIGIKPVEKVVDKGYNTVYEYDENLEAGKMEEKTPGKNGKTTITTSYDKENNKLVTKEETENPTDRVVRIGIKPIEKETELPFETEYVYDENMEAGKTEVTQEGKEGTAKITTFFNKETGKLETKIEREEPTKKIVKYGSKTEGKVVVESEKAYEIEIIEDPEMEAGKTEVIQEGKNGKVETTITIKNSKEVNRDTKVVEEPTKKIIKVGTKNVCEIPPVDPDPDKPTPDPEKPGEEDPKDPEKPEDPDPEKPTPDPEKPDTPDPGTPEKPEDPKDPETPDKPEDPETPEDPGTPEKPEEPGTPEKPENPGTPEKPEDPGTPEKPEVPETPDKPEDPGTPEKPETPETPEKPEVPETPETPEKPEDPKGPSEVEVPEVPKPNPEIKDGQVKIPSNIQEIKKNPNDRQGSDSPKTGIAGLGSTIATLIGSVSFLLASKKKEDEE